jgi:hypothetical protein
MDAFFEGDSLSESGQKEKEIGFLDTIKGENMLAIRKITFVKLMSLKANTARALNSMPGPSSRVKTMLV